jgi:hypothetical protein
MAAPKLLTKLLVTVDTPSTVRSETVDEKQPPVNGLSTVSSTVSSTVILPVVVPVVLLERERERERETVDAFLENPIFAGGKPAKTLPMGCVNSFASTVSCGGEQWPTVR